MKNEAATISSQGMIGKFVIIRCRDAGVHAGVLVEHEGRQCTLDRSRRLWRWWAKGGISLSEVAAYGIIPEKSRICAETPIVLTEICEIIPCSEVAETSISGASVYVP